MENGNYEYQVVDGADFPKLFRGRWDANPTPCHSKRFCLQA
jgi:hypothetical protein